MCNESSVGGAMAYTPIVGGRDFNAALRRLRRVLKIEADDVRYTHDEHRFWALYHTGYSTTRREPVRLGSTENSGKFGIHFRAKGEDDLDPLDVAGLFVKGDGKTYVTHKGIFGGKVRDMFRKHTSGNGWIDVDGVDSERFLVTQIDGDVSDAEILENVASFVAKVAPLVAKAKEHTDTKTGKDAGPARPTQSQPQVLNRIFYGPPGTGKTYQTARHCVEICDGTNKLSDDKIRDRYRELVNCKRIEFITFHQSYGYEEFVEGLRPAPSQDGQGGLRLEANPGVLKLIADRAREDRASPYVLVIDEINRANVSKVMGELITLLEEDKREGAEHEVAVTLPHSEEPFRLPANLHILGTMNTADRSIALIDTALRRRFEFKEVAPEPELLKNVVEGIDLPAVLNTINERLEYLRDRDHLIGHAWLMTARTKADVDRIMQRKIIPLIAEYFYNDWPKVRAVLGDTNDFVRRKPLEVPPGLDEVEADKRYRWTVLDEDEFPDGAYDRLVSGQSSAPADDANE